MATHFITARDGVYAILQGITGNTSGYLKIGHKYDRRFQTDAAGEGFPFYTVSPAFDRNTVAYKGTVNNWTHTMILVRIYFLYDNTEANETAFLTLLDLALTTLQSQSNIRLSNTVESNFVENVKTGYNDDAQPTMRIAEIECSVTQRLDRTA